MRTNEKIPKINEVVTTFGPYSKPFLNMCLSNEELELRWRMYFKSLLLSWENEHSEAFKLIEETLKLSMTDKSTYYFLLIRKLDLLLKMNDKDRGKSVYEKLRMEFGSIPPVTRKQATTVLLNYKAIRGIEKKEETFKKIRLWSKIYEQDNSAWAFILLGKARDEVKNGNMTKSFSIFLKAFRIAETIPHPSGMVNSLNDMAWYMRNIHSFWSCDIAKKAVHLAGWYFEDVEYVFFSFDTLMDCQVLAKDEELYKSVSLILLAKEYLPKGSGRGSQEHYHKRIELCKRIAPNFEVSRYENVKEIRTYLKKHMNSASQAKRFSGVGKANILAILNGRVKMIKGHTLKRLIKGLKIGIDTNSPFAIRNEYTKMVIENGFEKAIEEVEKMNQSERTILLISTYMVYLDRRKSLSYLSRKGKLKEAFDLLNNMERFKAFMFKRYETMEFVNSMIKAHPFIQARKDLAKAYLERMPKRIRERFIQKYIAMDEEEKKIIDRFARDYVRYDIKWGMRVSVPDEMKDLIQSFHLKKRPASLSYWALDDEEEREKLVSTLKKLNRHIL